MCLYLYLRSCYNGTMKGGVGMAVIECPMCGRQIADKVEECPGCGYSLKYLMAEEEQETQETPKIQEDTRTELEKLVDEICARNDNMYVAIKELRQATGMDLGSADDIIRKKYKGVARQEERKRSKQKRGRFNL